MPLHAQWSVLEDDPRSRNPEFIYQVFPKDDWNKSNFAAEKDTQWFRDAKYMMFVHFGLATYKNAELSWGVCQTRKAPDTGSEPYPEAEWTAWPNEMRLPDFDAKKMVEYAREHIAENADVLAFLFNQLGMTHTSARDFERQL